MTPHTELSKRVIARHYCTFSIIIPYEFLRYASKRLWYTYPISACGAAAVVAMPTRLDRAGRCVLDPRSTPLQAGALRCSALWRHGWHLAAHWKMSGLSRRRSSHTCGVLCGRGPNLEWYLAPHAALRARLAAGTHSRTGMPSPYRGRGGEKAKGVRLGEGKDRIQSPNDPSRRPPERDGWPICPALSSPAFAKSVNPKPAGLMIRISSVHVARG